MRMVWATKVLNPGMPRLAKIGENFVLPRSIPMPELLGALFFGGISAAVAGFLVPLIGLPTITGVTTFGCMGGFAGTMIVKWQPWKGENPASVGFTWVAQRRAQKPVVCGGVGQIAVPDEETGNELCPVCSLIVSADGLLTPHHVRRRRLYLGVMPIQTPETGRIRVIPGNVPNRSRKAGQFRR